MHAFVGVLVSHLRRLRYTLGRRRVLFFVPPRAVCAEIGVWKGDFSEQVLKLRHPREFHLIDPWMFESKYPGRWYGGDAAKNQDDMDNIKNSVCRRFAGNSAVAIHRSKSVEAAAQFPNEYFDWIYIDGDHSWEAVLNDLEAWHTKLKVRGTLALDDYDWRDEEGLYSIRYAVDRFLGTHKNLEARPIWGQLVITRRVLDTSRQ
jgi:methyltransferase family protein